MSEEIAPKIEPTLTLVADAPSIVAEPIAQPADAAKAEAEIAPEAKADERPKIEPIIEPKIEAKIEPKIEASAAPAKDPVMPRAAQIAPEPLAAKAAPIWLSAVRASDAKDETPAPAAVAPPRNGSRFPLLAATVAVAASLGAIAGSFGGAVFGRAPIETNVVAQNVNTTDEIKALKETVTLLRANTKALSDNVAALKLSISNTNAQFTKMNEGLDRRAAAAPAVETTGSIAKPAPAVLGAPPAPLQHPVVPGWTLRRVYDGAALIEGREGVIEVEPGITIAGLGRIEDIKKQDGRWVVFTSKGIIVPPGK